jgi:TldD protein
MTNTYMNGDKDPGHHRLGEEGPVCGQLRRWAGGHHQRKFVFSASEAYMIENGKITYPVKGATLIGNGPDVLTRVSMIGNDLALDTGVGTCGKEGQSVPVGVGQPTLRIDGLTVGGTA